MLLLWFILNHSMWKDGCFVMRYIIVNENSDQKLISHAETNLQHLTIIVYSLTIFQYIVCQNK